MTKAIEPPHLLNDLRTLKLPTIASEWRAKAEEAGKGRVSHADYLADLISLEVNGRRERRIQRRIKDAKFPFLKTLDAFDFAAQQELDRDEVLELFQCRFVESHGNVVFVGPIGTGKTHLLIALGIACCQQDLRVRYVTAAELTNALVEAKKQGQLARRLEYFARFNVVCLDELGYVPFDKEGADLLFGFITRVYERRSLIVTTNLPFANWSNVFLDATAAAAVIDRVVHHATILKTAGDSYRLRDATTTAKERST